MRNASWMGLEAESNSWNTTFSDLDIDMSGFSQYTTTLKFGNVGVYFEHYSYYDTLTNFRITGARLEQIASGTTLHGEGMPPASSSRSQMV